MCGITGWTDWSRDLGEQRSILERMTRTLAPRGPDAEGLWLSRHALLGHRRLAIIDLENGAQPMLAEAGGRVALTYSGEVYNFRELRAEPLSVRGLRVGLQLDPGCGLQPDAEIRAAIEAAARLFEEHGAQLRIVEPLMDRSLLDGLNDFWRARLWSELLLLDETRRARVLPYVHAWAEGGARVSGVDAVRGFNQTFEMRRRAARLFGEIDLLLTPTNQVEAFPADWASPLNDPQRPFEHIVFTVPWNMGEQPALSINCGFTAAGMPIGLQLVAPRFADTWLLRIGKTYEGWRGPIHGWPRPPAD